MSRKEGSLEAPVRHPIRWTDEGYYDVDALNQELERVFDICHGCRRCVSLCQAFPTLFDLVDEAPTMELDSVEKADFIKVVDHCYLCDLCFMTKCPYVPPHEWAVDFPHLMLQAKAQKFRSQGASMRDRLLTSTERLSKISSQPGVRHTINALNSTEIFRVTLEKVGKIHRGAIIPNYQRPTMVERVKQKEKDNPGHYKALGNTTGKVALFTTCFANYSDTELGEDFTAVFQHNDISITAVNGERCCGMPKLELGDLDSVDQFKQHNIPLLAELARQGFDLIAPIPSCVLMFKQELPLMYPEDKEVALVALRFFDPFEYLWLRHREKGLKTDFSKPLGNVSYQPACHQRVQNFGPRTRDILNLVPETDITTIERCSGHDGTYAVKEETRASSVKIAKPLVRKVNELAPQFHTSDCPMAAAHIGQLSEHQTAAPHPITLLRKAYGL